MFFFYCFCWWGSGYLFVTHYIRDQALCGGRGSRSGRAGARAEAHNNDNDDNYDNNNDNDKNHNNDNDNDNDNNNNNNNNDDNTNDNDDNNNNNNNNNNKHSDTNDNNNDNDDVMLRAAPARGFGHVHSGDTGVSVNKNTLLFCEPLACNPAARTALQPLIWCFAGEMSQRYSSPGECSFPRHR